MASRAAERNRQVALTFSDVVRQQVNQQRGNAVDELACLRKRSYVPRHLGMLAGVLLELRNVIRIGQEPHVEHEVAVYGHAVTVAEARHVDADLSLIAVPV